MTLECVYLNTLRITEANLQPEAAGSSWCASYGAVINNNHNFTAKKFKNMYCVTNGKRASPKCLLPTTKECGGGELCQQCIDLLPLGSTLSFLPTL